MARRGNIQKVVPRGNIEWRRSRRRGIDYGKTFIFRGKRPGVPPRREYEPVIEAAELVLVGEPYRAQINVSPSADVSRCVVHRLELGAVVAQLAAGCIYSTDINGGGSVLVQIS